MGLAYQAFVNGNRLQLNDWFSRSDTDVIVCTYTCLCSGLMR